METQSPGYEPKKGDRSLYTEEYGMVQGRTVAQEYTRILEEKFKDSIGKKVIELGVGSGSLIPFLREKFGEKTFGMDISDWILRSNKIRNGLVQGDLQDLPIAKSSVDVVVSLHTFEHSPDLKRALEEVERILIPGGEAIIVVPRPQLGIRQLGALVDTLRIYAGVEKLLEEWKKTDGNKVAAIWKQFKKAWDEAGKLHVQNVTPEMIEEVITKMEITEARTIFVAEEMGSSWVVTLRKK